MVKDHFTPNDCNEFWIHHSSLSFIDLPSQPFPIDRSARQNSIILFQTRCGYDRSMTDRIYSAFKALAGERQPEAANRESRADEQFVSR